MITFDADPFAAIDAATKTTTREEKYLERVLSGSNFDYLCNALRLHLAYVNYTHDVKGANLAAKYVGVYRALSKKEVCELFIEWYLQHTITHNFNLINPPKPEDKKLDYSEIVQKIMAIPRIVKILEDCH